MPYNCRWAGVKIVMYFRDHNPPHFRASYAEHSAKIEIGTERVFEGGDLPPRQK